MKKTKRWTEKEVEILRSLKGTSPDWMKVAKKRLRGRSLASISYRATNLEPARYTSNKDTRKNDWTEREKAYLQKYWGNSLAEKNKCFRHLKRHSSMSVRQQAWRLGLAEAGTRTNWTGNRVAYLVAHYKSERSVKSISKKLGVPEDAVLRKAKRLGLPEAR